MTDLRQAAQQALEALEAKGDAWIVLERKAIISLRAALAETTHDYRFRYDRPCYKCKSLYCPSDCKDTTSPQQQAEPTPWRDMVVVSLVREGIDKHKARELADHFATPPQRKPLTNEQITKAFNDAMAKRPKDASNAETNRLFVRAIEAAHNIKEQP